MVFSRSVFVVQCWVVCNAEHTLMNTLFKQQNCAHKGMKSQWHHNERDGVSNHQPYDCLLGRLFRHRSKKTSKLRLTGLCEGDSPVTDEFPAQRASNVENISIWWRHHEFWLDSKQWCFLCPHDIGSHSHGYAGSVFNEESFQLQLTMAWNGTKCKHIFYVSPKEI